MEVWLAHYATLLNDLSYTRIGHKSSRPIKTRCLKKDENIVRVVGPSKHLLFDESVLLSDGTMRIVGFFPCLKIPDSSSNKHTTGESLSAR
jgi:hypothetical protein